MTEVLEEDDDRPTWPGPLTSDSSWADVEARVDYGLAERARRSGGRQNSGPATRRPVPETRSNEDADRE